MGYIKAVDGVSFSLKRGETLGLVGESGCGKTTVGRCLLRLIEPTAGRVIFNGQNLLELDHGELLKIRASLQIIFQDKRRQGTDPSGANHNNQGQRKS